MDARDSISMLLAERQGLSGVQEQGIKDVFKDYQAPYRGAPSQWDIHNDPSLQNQYGNASRPSPEWTGQRPSWANTTNLNGVNWSQQGANVLSPAAPPQYRQEQYGAQSGPYDPFGGAAGGGGQWLPQQSSYPPGGSSGAPGADGGVGLPPAGGGLQQMQSNAFGGRVPGGPGAGWSPGAEPGWLSQLMPSLMQRFGGGGGMPSGPGGFGGKATPGAPPSTLGANNG